MSGDGWIRIGRWDSVRRRSTWVRLSYMGPVLRLIALDGEDFGGVTGPCVLIEMCSGREGDDASVSIARGDIDDRAFCDLKNVLETQIWSQDT